MKTTALKITFAVVSLVLIVKLVDFGSFVRALFLLQPPFFLAGLAVIPLIVVLRCIRWNTILNASQVNLPFTDVCRIYLIGLFLGNITPSKVGDFGKSYYLYKRGVSAGRSFSFSILDRIFDVLVVAIASAISVFAIAGNFLPLFLPLLLAVFFAAVAAIFNKRIFIFLAGAILPHFSFLKKYAGDNVTDPQELYAPFGALRNRRAHLGGTVALSFAIWVLSAALVMFFLLALGEQLSLVHALIAVSLAALLGLLPITISGLGVREATFVSVFALFAITSERALAASLLYFILGNVVPALAGYGVYLSWKGKNTAASNPQKK